MKLSEALRISQAVPDSGAEEFHVHLACGFTPLHLATFLAAHLSLRHPARDVKVLTGDYGDLTGTLARLGGAGAHAAAVILEWSDLDPRLGLRRLGGWGPKVLMNISTTAESSALRILQLLETAAQSTPIALCLPTLPLPPISYLPASQAATHDLFLRKVLQNFALSAAEISNVKLVNQQIVDEMSAISARLDVKSELMTGFPYGLNHASIVADLLSQLIRPSSPKKALITDLDDTLWRGLLGEDGVEGVSWDLDSRSHIHALYQQLLGALAESGVFIGIASKNDHDLALKALAREDLIVSKHQLFPLEINWHPKSSSIDRILRIWNIVAEDVVFVDDSPLELAEVKTKHRQMECLLFPKDDDDAAYRLLGTLRDLFGKQTILEEDSFRVDSVRRSTELETRSESLTRDSLTDFLKEIGAELTLSPVNAAGEARAFELINKTNQFNLNGRRLSLSEFQNALRRAGAVSLLVSYRDKFGPLGKIAVLLGVIDSSVLKVDTWVMSCRAFSRHIEHSCLNYLFNNWNATEVELAYHATARNGPLREFLKQFADVGPDSLCRIQREIFMGRKPELFHSINGSYA